MSPAGFPSALLFQQPYRLFFLGAGVHAVAGMGWWVAHFLWGVQLPAVMPFFWHGYEMIFGFAGAVIIGFILTAAANWTGRSTVNTPALLGLFLAWLVARLAAFLEWPAALTLAGDGIALVGLTVALARVLLLAGNRRNLRFLPITGLLAVAAIVFQLSTMGHLPEWRYPLLRGAVDLVLILMVIMGGRVIPFFTQRRLPALEVTNPEWLGFYTSALVVLSVVLAWLVPGNVAAMISWFAGCFLMARLFYWSPWGTRREPMLWILHVGYLWLALALFLRGGAMAWNWMPLSTALHAITVGGLGCLTLGMMARVSLGHGGHDIRAPWWLAVAFGMMGVAAVPRLLAAWPAVMSPQLGYGLSGSLWAAAFLVFVVGFLPVLLGPRGDAK